MSTTGLIDELSALLDSEAVEAAATKGGSCNSRDRTVGDMPSAALALTGQMQTRTDSDTEPAPDVANTKARAAQGEALLDDVMLAVRDAVRVLRKTFEENEADFDDACKALPLLHRVLEHTDKMKAAARETKSAPMLTFTIVLDDTPQEAPPGRRSRLVVPSIDVVDVVERNQ